MLNLYFGASDKKESLCFKFSY